MKIASLFSGIGGIDLGFKQAGFDIAWANEFDKDAATTYRNNFGNDHLVEDDIRNVDVSSIPNFDVLVAGFPCQPFSIVGRKKGFADPRGNLFFEIAKIVDKKRPEVIFLENVENLIEHDNGKTFIVIYSTLAQFGYAVRYAVLDGQIHGNVPQRRRRIFIVAFLDIDKCNAFEYPKELKLTTSLNDILHREQKHSDCYYYNEGSIYYDELKRVVTDKTALYKINDYGVSKKAHHICPTLTANMGTFPDRVPVIIDDFGIRKITPQECLLLQGFPKDFTFPSIPLASAYKQCGNSVVVPVIKRIAEKIMEIMTYDN